jgi:two-component system sensor kinase FixL
MVVLCLVLTGLATWIAREEAEREAGLAFNVFVQRLETSVRLELTEHYERVAGWRDALELIPASQHGRIGLLFRNQSEGMSLAGIRDVGIIVRPGASSNVPVQSFHFGPDRDPLAASKLVLRDTGRFIQLAGKLVNDDDMLLLDAAEAGLEPGKVPVLILPVGEPGGLPARGAAPVAKWLVATLDFNFMLAHGPAAPIPKGIAVSLLYREGGIELGCYPMTSEHAEPPPGSPLRRATQPVKFGAIPLDLRVTASPGVVLGDEEDWTWAVALGGLLGTFVFGYLTHHQLLRREEMADRARQLQRDAHESEQRFRDIVESSRDWVWETDAQGVYTYSSPSSELLFGYPPAEIVGTRGEFLWHEQVKQISAPFHASQVRMLRHRAGNAITMESRAIRVLGADGSLEGYRGFDRDISARLQLEGELHSLQGRLLKLIQAEAAGQTLMGLAHEINQPLAAIAAYNQACLRMAESESGLRPDMLAAIRATADNAVLAGDIIRKFRGVLAATRVQQNSLDIPRIIQEVVATVESRIRIEEIRLSLSIDTRLPDALGDATLIKQAVINLIGNAIDAMAGQPVRELRIVVDAPSDGPQAGKVRIAVQDSGPGVREELWDRIFEPYFTTRAGGLGMGLAISKSIVEAHGESIGFNPRPEGGASFWFTLGNGDERHA